jgi:hypothetical protein
MELPTYFSDFLTEIRLTDTQIQDCIGGHTTLRERLHDDKDLSPCIVTTFLQGSYRRATAVRPYEGKRADVDVILVSKLSKDEYTPEAVIKEFVPFMDKHYKGKYTLQGRSIGIALSYVDLDLVVTAAPSEAEIGILESESVTTARAIDEAIDWAPSRKWLNLEEHKGLTHASLAEAIKKEPEWKLSPLLIPDRDVKKWQRTHPLEQIKWTWKKNRSSNGHYVNVVKAIKWWRRINHPTPKYPKGYPVEHLIGICCPDNIDSVAAGVAATLETIALNYKNHADMEQTPSLADHGVPEHNVMHRVSGKDFAKFHEQVCAAAKTARAAFDADTVKKSADEWRKLFGDKFPEAPDDSGDNGTKDTGPKGGYTPRKEISGVVGGRFA